MTKYAVLRGYREPDGLFLTFEKKGVRVTPDANVPIPRSGKIGMEVISTTIYNFTGCLRNRREILHLKSALFYCDQEMILWFYSESRIRTKIVPCQTIGDIFFYRGGTSKTARTSTNGVDNWNILGWSGKVFTKYRYNQINRSNKLPSLACVDSCLSYTSMSPLFNAEIGGSSLLCLASDRKD